MDDSIYDAIYNEWVECPIELIKTCILPYAFASIDFESKYEKIYVDFEQEIEKDDGIIFKHEGINTKINYHGNIILLDNAILNVKSSPIKIENSILFITEDIFDNRVVYILLNVDEKLCIICQSFNRYNSGKITFNITKRIIHEQITKYDPGYDIKICSPYNQIC